MTAKQNRFENGDSYRDKGAAFRSYGIHDNFAYEERGQIKTHFQKIEVHGDKKLRDLIVKLLNKHFAEKGK